MAGKCKYCGFVGTQDEIVDHAGEMCQGDYQPDTMVKNLTDNQQPLMSQFLKSMNLGTSLICQDGEN